MTEISPIGTRKKFSGIFQAYTRAQSFLEKVTGAMSTHFSYIRECNGVTAVRRREPERGGWWQVGRAFSANTAACFWHYPLDKEVVVEAPETDALTPPGGNSVNSVHGDFRGGALRRDRVMPVGARGGKKGKRGWRCCERRGGGRVCGPSEAEEGGKGSPL